MMKLGMAITKTNTTARMPNPGPAMGKPALPNVGGTAGIRPGRVLAFPAQASNLSESPGITIFHRIGLLSYCVYLFSAYGNDLSLHVFGEKAYLSWFSGILVAIALIPCATPLRGLRTVIGKAWLGMVCCLLLSTMFSMWRSRSAGLLVSYIPKTLCLFYYACAFTLTLKQCRILIIANVFCTSVVLLSASLFGQTVEGRFCIPSSYFMGGGNDLALALVSGLGFALFLLSQRSVVAQLLGAAEFLLSIYFLLKTGSRGGFLALGVFLVICLIFSSRRWKLVALMAPALVLVAIVPGSALNRLVEIAAPGTLDNSTATTEATESQLERTMLLQKSISFAMAHPILGTGPDTFQDALWREDVKNQTHTHTLGTHNTYTQVASECGLPALFCYMIVLCGSIGSNYRIMKRTRRVPGAEKVFTMALCLFGSLIAFAVGTVFHHDAYAVTLPVLSGVSAALALASRGGDIDWIRSETAAGNA
jgi:O-antigen ligase